MPPLPPDADREVLPTGSGGAVSCMTESNSGSAPPISAPATGIGAFAVLRNRPDFLRAAQARRQGTAGFLLQARQRHETEVSERPVRVGYTCSKKIGNAVARNRAKRRLREIARQVMPELARHGWDYVLVARPGATITRGFADLLSDLTDALSRIHDGPQAPRRPSKGRSAGTAS